MPTYDVPLRDTLEKAGYKVTWQGKGLPILAEKDGQVYEISPNDYVLKGDKAYLSSEALPDLMKKAGYQWVREALPASAGYEYHFDPKTKQTTVSHPFGQSYTFTNAIIAGGRTYITPEEIETARKVTGPAYKAELAELTNMAQQHFTQERERLARYTAYQNAMLQNYLTQVNNYIRQYGDEALAMLKTYQEHYQQALQQLQRLMQPDTRVPETVKLALSVLDKNLQENLRQLAEEMNRRGIYQSGIAAEMERRMREGALTEQQKILAQWLDDVHRRAYDATLRYADYLTRYASGLIDVYDRARLEPIRMAQQAAQQAYLFSSQLAADQYKAESDLANRAFDVITGLRQLGMQYDFDVAKALLQRRWTLEDQQRARQWELEDQQRARQWELEDQQRARQWALEDWKRQRQAEIEDRNFQANLQRELARLKQQSQGDDWSWLFELMNLFNQANQ